MGNPSLGAVRKRDRVFSLSWRGISPTEGRRWWRKIRVLSMEKTGNLWL
jgi:hypothetical protein